MEGIIFVRRLFGNWLAIGICVLYELFVLYDLITIGKVSYPNGAIHMIGMIVMTSLFKFTKDDNELANKYGYYLFAVLLITSWFAYR